MMPRGFNLKVNNSELQSNLSQKVGEERIPDDSIRNLLILRSWKSLNLLSQMTMK